MLYDKNSFVTENNAVRNGRKREVIMSRYTKNDIFRMVEEEDVEFIRLQFTDIFGVLKILQLRPASLNVH